MPYISWPAFILSFALGVFYIYISLPKQRVVTVYPTQDNADYFNFRDKAHNCFRFEQEMKLLDKIGVNAWDLIQANSGGHKCITNISGLNYLGRSTRPPQSQYRYNSENEDSPTVKFTKMIANQFQKVLKEKIELSKTSN